MDEEYLAHHGIKGQKWGVRRFQNPDGTRTELGKKRENANSVLNYSNKKKAESRPEKKHRILKEKVIKNPKKLYKNRNQFTEKEINEIISKIEKNQKMKDLAEREIQRGERSYRRVTNLLTSTAAAVTAIGTIYAASKKIGR